MATTASAGTDGVWEGEEKPEEVERGGEVEPHQDAEELIQGMTEVIDVVGSFGGDYWRTQRKECLGLARRMKMLVAFLEEIQDFEGEISGEALAKLREMKAAFVCAKRLLRCCHDGSKIYLASESEAIMGRFHGVYDKLCMALDGMPYHELDISFEVKEQVELMCSQLRRAKKRIDTQDFELAMDIMIVFDKKDDRNADSAILERLSKRLELHTLADLRKETMAIKKLVQERRGQNVQTTQKIIDLLNKLKKVVGVEDINGIDEVSLPKYLEKCPSLVIPNEFLCPISLEIMIDPVIVASGQTYERASIQKWLDAGHRTCPKTRQALAHLSLASNYAIRNMISQWCELHKVQLTKRYKSSNSDNITREEEITMLVHDLNSCHLKLQRKAVRKVRMLSKENPENRVLIARNGGIPFLVKLLAYPDHKIQENAVTALLNLSIDELNKRLIAKEEAIPFIIDILKNGTLEAKENSAAALFSLSMLDENKVTIGSLNGIPPLVDLLQNGTVRGKKDAAIALFNLSFNQANRVRAVDAGIVAPLLKLLTDTNMGMVDEILSVLLLLASLPEGRAAIGNQPFLEIIVDLIKEGTPKNKECAISLLLEMGMNDSSLIPAALHYGVYEHICDMSKSGTSRAQRKADSLLQHISKCQTVA